MKCVKIAGKIVRVPEAKAAELVSKGASYVSRSEWKEKVRGPVNSAKCEGRSL